MKYYIIAGEASGDLHGSYLIRALRTQDPDAKIRFWGGDKMARAARRAPDMHIRQLSFMGVWELLKNIGKIRQHFALCKASVLEFQPEALILIDYPGFNLRIAQWATRQNINVQYYISPKLWAWNKKRIRKIRDFVNKLYVIFPFEVEFYKDYGIDVEYVGNPLTEQIAEFVHLTSSVDRKHEAPVIALLPGSRIQEVRRILPTMLDVIPHFPEYKFIIAGIHTVPDELYRKVLQHHPHGQKPELQYDTTYQILRSARLALVASGTSTLEAALLGAPQIVCYKTAPLTYFLAKALVKVKYISLVNLIMDAPIVTELIQSDCSPNRLQNEMTQVLKPEHSAPLKAQYQKLSEKLGKHSSSKLVASGVINAIKGR